ncbi:hypothetical protein [Leuconostoc pseudomesenteroides]|uniref:hypothetical protein n=1 Tax=Leuconostoc pseudomesenteroides TaxID=33968 RepID=UPI0032DE8C3A
MLQGLNLDPAIYQKQPKVISLRHSQSEEWYFQQLSRWLDRHPEAIGAKFNRSELYRFALHFFVENIALNATNAKLPYGDLIDKLNALALKRENAKLEAQLANLENLLGFITTMQYRQLNFIPENIDFKNGLVNYGINPIAEEYTQLFDDMTEIVPNNELGKAYAKYKEIRGYQKLAIKKRHQKRSFYPD